MEGPTSILPPHISTATTNATTPTTNPHTTTTTPITTTTKPFTNYTGLTDIELPKPIWWDKEFTNTYLTYLKYRPRFLVLSTTNLHYFDHAPSEQQLQLIQSSDEQKGRTIPLSSIDLHQLTECGIKEPEVLHIQVPHHIYRFRAHDLSNAIKWRMTIASLIRTNNLQNGLDVAGNPTSSSTSQPNFADRPLPSHPGLNKTPTPVAGEWKDELTPEIIEELNSKEDLIIRFEGLLFNSMEKAKYIANYFFESLSMLSIKERNIRAKEMGKALVAWLEVDASTGENLNDNDSDKDLNDSSDVNEETLQGIYLYHSKLDIFIVWLRTALSREYLASCKFDESGNGEHDDNSSESSTMTHSTIKSRMKVARKGSIIMPFRADTAECLFISSIIHSASLKYTLLYHVLFSVLRPVAANPENYTYPKPVPANISSHITLNPAPEPTAVTVNPRASGTFAPVQEDTRRNSIRRGSQRFFGMFRNLLSGNRSNAGNGTSNSTQTNPTPNERPSSADMAKALSSFSNYYNFLNPNGAKNEENSKQQLISLEELASLTPVELRRVETRKRLLDCALLLVNRLDEICPYFPIAIKMIVRTIRDLIIITTQQEGGGSQFNLPVAANHSHSSSSMVGTAHPHHSHHSHHLSAHHSTGQLTLGIASSDEVLTPDGHHPLHNHHHLSNHHTPTNGGHSSISPPFTPSEHNSNDNLHNLVVEEDAAMAELYKNRKRFEYGTYFTSCSALLFLRLICRAIISPDEYGVISNHNSFLHGGSQKQQHQQQQSEIDEETALPYRGLPAMYFIAQTLTQVERLKAESVLKADTTNGTPFSKPPLPSSSTNYPYHAHPPQYAAEILVVAKEVSEQIEYRKALKCLETFQSKKFTLSFRESMHIEKEQLNLYQLSLRDSPPSNHLNPNGAESSNGTNHGPGTYSFDYTKPTTRWALAEVAKSVQHIANISCLPKEEMQVFARDSLIRQNVGIGAQDKDSIDTYVLTGYEMNTVNTQIFIATRIKEVYEKLGDLPAGNW